jgi:hypothetical protein
VDKSKKKEGEGKQNYVQIFPTGPDQLGKKDELEKAFAAQKNLIFSEKQLKNKLKKWNSLPYFDPLIGSDKIYSFSNYFDKLKDFRELIPTMTKLSKTSLEMPHLLVDIEDLYQKHFAQMFKMLYFDNFNMLNMRNLSVKEYLQSLRSQESASFWAFKIINYGSQEHKQEMKKHFFPMHKAVTEAALTIVHYYVNHKDLGFLDDFFKNCNNNSLKEQVTSRNKVNRRSPAPPSILERNFEILNQSDLNAEWDGPYDGQFKEQVDIVKKSYLAIYDEAFDAMQKVMEEDGSFLAGKKMDKLLNDPEYENLTSSYEALAPEDFKSKFDPSKKQEFRDKMEASDFLEVFNDMLLHFYIGRFIRVFDNKLKSQLPKQEVIQEMNMDLNDAETFGWFRRLLMIFGQVKYVPKLDDELMKQSSQSIFSVSKSLLV